jgi:uncharacterized protein
MPTKRSRKQERGKARSSARKKAQRAAERFDSSAVETRDSGIHGRGVYAIRTIPKGTRIIEYLGERITHAEADRRYARKREDDGHTFLFIASQRTVIDAGVNGNEARFINHSCAPNCDAVIDGGRIWIETIHDIEPGEELVYDYAYILEEWHSPAAKARYPCHCGAITCRGTIRAKKR